MGFEKAKPPVGLQPVQGRSPSCRACPRCRTPVPFPAPLSSRRQRWEDRTPNTPKYVGNFRRGVHHQRALAEKKLDAALEQNVQDPVLGHLQRNMEKQYMKLWWLDAPHSSHSRPHGSMATGDRHGCIRQNMICRFFGPLRGWTPSNQLNQLKPKNSMDFVICSRSITLLCQMPGLAVRVVVEQGGGSQNVCRYTMPLGQMPGFRCG